MKDSNDISNLYKMLGENPENYQEIVRATELERSNDRWPILSAIQNMDIQIPPVDQRNRTDGGTPSSMVVSEKLIVRERFSMPEQHLPPIPDVRKKPVHVPEPVHVADAAVSAQPVFAVEPLIAVATSGTTDPATLTENVVVTQVTTEAVAAESVLEQEVLVEVEVDMLVETEVTPVDVVLPVVSVVEVDIEVDAEPVAVQEPVVVAPVPVRVPVIVKAPPPVNRKVEAPKLATVSTPEQPVAVMIVPAVRVPAKPETSPVVSLSNIRMKSGAEPKPLDALFNRLANEPKVVTSNSIKNKSVLFDRLIRS